MQLDQFFQLTQGQARFVLRLFGWMSLGALLGSFLLEIAPLPTPIALHQVMTATHKTHSVAIALPKYSTFLGQRSDPFAFTALPKTAVVLKNLVDPKPQPTRTQSLQQTQPKPVIPQLDLGGLDLIGTAPGTDFSAAILLDQRTGATLTVKPGDSVRNGTVKTILADRVQLVLGSQVSEIQLEQIPGREGLQQQLAQIARTAKQESDSGQVTVSTQPRRTLGISGRILSRQKAQQLGLDQGGFEITRVQHSGYPLQQGDILLSIAGQPIHSAAQMQQLLTRVQSKELNLTIYRDGQHQSVNIPWYSRE